MGLTNNQKLMIEAISKNDLAAAKTRAIACLAEDTTAKNQMWVERYKSILQNAPKQLEELPPNLKGILLMEDVSENFREDRYYLTEREAETAKRIIHMNKVGEKLAAMGITYLNATLLYGESGTGKTLFGRYIAYRMQLPFCYVNFSYLIDSLMGKTSKNLNLLFHFASQSPCVLLLDELDCIGTRRGNSGASGAEAEAARITITLIQELNNLPNNVILLGATNRPELIDEAIHRRFKLHEVQPFSFEEKFALLKRYNDSTGCVFSDRELDEMAAMKENQSYLIQEFIERLADRL